MKKIIVSILVIGLLMSVTPISMGGEESASEEESACYEINLDYSFQQPTITKIEIDGVMYDHIENQGISNFGDPGEPAIPAKNINVLLPYGMLFQDIQVTTDDKTFLNGRYLIEPGQQIYPIGYNVSIDPTTPDQMIYGSIDPFPGKLYSDVAINKIRGYNILTFKLHYVQYVPKIGKIYYYSNMNVEISIRSAEDIEELSNGDNFRGLTSDTLTVQGLVDNPETLRTYPKREALDGGSSTYDYIIITEDTFLPAFQQLTNWKETRDAYTNHDNLNTKIEIISDITDNPEFWYNGYWGDGGNESMFNDTQCQIRNFIKMAYNNWSTEYILLGGDDEIIPHRGVYAEVDDVTDDDIACDMYFGALDGNWNDDLDDRWGEGDEADLFAEVYIGRAPVDSLEEAYNFVNKTIRYENSTDMNYLKKAVFIGEQPDPFTQTANDKDKITTIVPQYTTTKLYERDGTFNRSLVLTNLNDSLHVVNHMGHASPYDLMTLDGAEVYGFRNTDCYFIYTVGCYCGSFDNRWPFEHGHHGEILEDCIGENFTITKCGAFAFIGNSRYGWYIGGETEGPDVKYDKSFFQTLSDVKNIGRALQLAKENLYLGDGYIFRWTYFTKNLLGDPETSVVVNISAPTAYFAPPAEYLLEIPTINKETLELQINGTARRGNAEGSTFSHYVIECGKGRFPDSWSSDNITLINNGEDEITNGLLGFWNVTYLDDGVYTLRLTVYDNLGIVGQDWFFFRYWRRFHEDIKITSNDEFTAENGVTSGSGTEDDPYIMEGWDLGGIWIQDTTAFFVIRDCFMFGRDAVYLWSVENGTVQNCTLEAKDDFARVAFDISDSENLLIEHCNISKYHWGAFDLYYSNNNIIRNCNLSGMDEFYDEDYGFLLQGHSGGNKIYHNNVFNFGKGAWTYQSSSNQWDDGEGKGNYWDDYKGIDILPPWGIGDIPYIISFGNKDRYPLMGPYPNPYNNNQATRQSQSQPNSQQSSLNGNSQQSPSSSSSQQQSSQSQSNS